jgi:hypothetical protein
LQIDHINNDGKRHRASLSHADRTQFYRYLKSHQYPSGYQVLCRQCNIYKDLLFKTGAPTDGVPRPEIGSPAWRQIVEAFVVKMGGREAILNALSQD